LFIRSRLKQILMHRKDANALNQYFLIECYIYLLYIVLYMTSMLISIDITTIVHVDYPASSICS
jgi:hypothetical protein